GVPGRSFDRGSHIGQDMVVDPLEVTGLPWTIRRELLDKIAGAISYKDAPADLRRDVPCIGKMVAVWSPRQLVSADLEQLFDLGAALGLVDLGHDLGRARRLRGGLGRARRLRGDGDAGWARSPGRSACCNQTTEARQLQRHVRSYERASDRETW